MWGAKITKNRLYFHKRKEQRLPLHDPPASRSRNCIPKIIQVVLIKKKKKRALRVWMGKVEVSCLCFLLFWKTCICDSNIWEAVFKKGEVFAWPKWSLKDFQGKCHFSCTSQFQLNKEDQGNTQSKVRRISASLLTEVLCKGQSWRVWELRD